MSDELRRLAKAAIISTIINEGTPGVLGRADGTLYFTDAGGVIHRDRIWCRIGQGDSPTEVVVDCTGVPRQYNLPVIVANRNGRPTAIRTDQSQVNVFTGGRQIDVTEHAWTHGRFGPDPFYVAGPAVLPLMAVPSNPPAMTVQVREGFYRYQGVEKVFLTQTSSSLAAHVPALSTQQKFVVLSINRSTNALTVTTGTGTTALVGEVAPFTATEVLAIVDDLSDVHMPIAAIRFYYGQTRITANDIFMDLRLWGGEYSHGVPSTGDDHTQYLLLAGRAGSQVAYGGTAANEDLTLEGTSHATKTTSYVLLQPGGGNVGIGTSAPLSKFHIDGPADTIFYLINSADGNRGAYIKNTATTVEMGTNSGSRELVLTVDATMAGKFDTSLRFHVGEIRAKDGNGLNLKDDGGNLGLFLKDGGNVGAGLTSPETKFEMTNLVRIRGVAAASLVGPSTAQGIEMYFNTESDYDGGGGSGVGVLQAYDRDASAYRDFIFNGSNFGYWIAGNLKMYLDANGNFIQLGNNIGLKTVDFGSGAGVFGVANANANPSTNPTGGFVMYGQSGAAKIRGSSGTVTTIANAEPHCPVCGRDYMQEFDNEDFGYFAICLSCLADSLGAQPWIIRDKSRL